MQLHHAGYCLSFTRAESKRLSPFAVIRIFGFCPRPCCFQLQCNHLCVQLCKNAHHLPHGCPHRIIVKQIRFRRANDLKSVCLDVGDGTFLDCQLPRESVKPFDNNQLDAITFCTIQYSRERRLEEEYAFKASISVSLTPYRELVLSILEKDATVDKGKYTDFVIDSVKNVFTSPTDRVFEGEKKEGVSFKLLKQTAEVLGTAVKATKT